MLGTTDIKFTHLWGLKANRIMIRTHTAPQSWQSHWLNRPK